MNGVSNPARLEGRSLPPARGAIHTWREDDRGFWFGRAEGRDAKPACAVTSCPRTVSRGRFEFNHDFSARTEIDGRGLEPYFAVLEFAVDGDRNLAVRGSTGILSEATAYGMAI